MIVGIIIGIVVINFLSLWVINKLFTKHYLHAAKTQLDKYVSDAIPEVSNLLEKSVQGYILKIFSNRGWEEKESNGFGNRGYIQESEAQYALRQYIRIIVKKELKMAISKLVKKNMKEQVTNAVFLLKDDILFYRDKLYELMEEYNETKENINSDKFIKSVVKRINEFQIGKWKGKIK